MRLRGFAAIAAAMTSALLLTACGESVEVPPAHVGKILTSEGFTPDVIPPSKFRLDVCVTLCDKLVVAEASDYAKIESMRIFMPKDQLNLSVDVRGVYAIDASPEVIERVFDRIPAAEVNSRVSYITMQRVYDTYAAQVIRETARTILADYSIEEMMENREEIGERLFQQVRAHLRATPIQAIQFGLADMQPPEIVVKAQELAKQRQIEIQRAEFDKQVKLKEAEAEIEIAEKDKIVRLKKAEAILAENQKVAESVSEKYLMYRYLEVLEEAARGESTIFFPLDMTQSAGLQNRIFNPSK